MSEWEQQKLEDCADVLDHLRVPVNEEQRSRNPGNTAYYGANGIQGYIDDWIFDEPLILMAEDGGYFEEFASRPVAYKISGKSWVNNHAHVLRPKPIIDFDFLFYSLEHKNITPFIKGGTRAKLNQKELREIEILTPKDKNRQRRIASILQTIDEAIEKTEALIEKYGQIKSGMMQDLFTRGLTPDGKLRPTRDEAPELYKETPIGWIPKDWVFAKLKKFVRSAQYGISTSLTDAEVGVPVLRMNNIQDNSFDVTNLKYSDTIAAKALNLKFGDVLYNRTNSMQHVGKTAIWREELEECSFASYLVRINLDEETLCADYFAHWMSRVSSQNAIRRYATPAVQQVNINPTNLQKIWISCPSQMDEQKLVIERLDHLDAKLEMERQFLKKLETQKKGLMHDLLTGEVQVKLDEPEAAHV